MKAGYKTWYRIVMLLSGYFSYDLGESTRTTWSHCWATMRPALCWQQIYNADAADCLPAVSGLCCVTDGISARKLEVTDEYRLASAIFTQIIAKWRNCSRKHAVVGAFYAAVILPFRPSFGNHFCNLNWAIWIDRCHLYRYRHSNKPRMACLSICLSGR